MSEPNPEPFAAIDGNGEFAGVSSAARWWYGPLTNVEPWTATLYLFVSALLSLVWLIAMVVGVAVSVPLSLVGIGLPMLMGTFALASRLVRWDRHRAGWVGEPVAEAPLPKLARGLAGARSVLSDGPRWRLVGYLVLAPFVFVVLLALALALWAVPLYLISLPLWGWAVGMSVIGMTMGVLTGVVLAGLVPRGVQQLGRAGAGFVRAAVGPDRVAVMQQQVDTLTANREEILSAVASERRRIERNLHDGVQQHLVAQGIDLGLAEQKMASDPEAALELLRDARAKNRDTIGELRIIGRGLHPAVLDDRGLDAALSALVSSSPVPVSLSVSPGLQAPMPVAEAAYFVVSEAVTNMLKHAKARAASVSVEQSAGTLVVDVHDDGHGGADQSAGTGLAGIAARVRALDGSLSVHSPRGGPTHIHAEIPNAMGDSYE